MRLWRGRIFSDFVVGSAGAFTSPRFERILPCGDAIAFQVRVAIATGGSTLRMFLQHSCDRRNWSDYAAWATPAIASGYEVYTFTTDAAGMLSRGRVLLVWSSPAQGHVRIEATVRG